jgi:hypothetical protein
MGDPVLAFGLALLAAECPGLGASAMSQMRSWAALFLDGVLPYDEFRRVVQDECGSAAMPERLREILSVAPEPLPEPRQIGRPRADARASRCRTRSWVCEEDNRLLAGVRRFGLGPDPPWSAIAAFVGNGRTRSQCSQRWIRVLDPRISRAPWTLAEDRALLRLIDAHGQKSWMKIATEIGNRSDVQCRYRYAQLQREGAEARPFAPLVPPPQQQQLLLQRGWPAAELLPALKQREGPAAAPGGLSWPAIAPGRPKAAPGAGRHSSR